MNSSTSPPEIFVRPELVQADVLGESVPSPVPGTPTPPDGQEPPYTQKLPGPADAIPLKTDPAALPAAEDENKAAFLGERNLPHP